MSSRGIGICILACLSSISVPAPISLAYAETQAAFYVSTNGNDGWSGKLEAPKHLARTVHGLYFEPKYEEFRPRTIWSLSNAFTSAFKELDPIPQCKATAKLGEFLEARFSQSF